MAADVVYWWLHDYISCGFYAKNYFNLCQILCSPVASNPSNATETAKLSLACFY